MKLHRLIKAAASRKVLGKMLGVMLKNPEKYKNIAKEDDLKYYQEAVSGEDKRPSNNAVSRALKVDEPEVRKFIRKAQKRQKTETKIPRGIMNVYNIDDADQNPGEISEATPHLATDYRNPKATKQKLNLYGAKDLKDLSEIAIKETDNPSINETRDYERVTTHNYLNPRILGTLTQDLGGRSELIERANEAAIRLQNPKQDKRIRGMVKEDLGEMERALKGKKFPKPEGMEVQIPSKPFATPEDPMPPLPVAEHQMAFKGHFYHPNYPKMEQPNKEKSVWVSPHPEVAQTYGGPVSSTATRQSTAPYYIKYPEQADPRIIQEFSKPKYRNPRRYT